MERLLSEKGKDRPIEIVDCYHALPVEVTENGIVSTQKIGTKVQLKGSEILIRTTKYARMRACMSTCV